MTSITIGVCILARARNYLPRALDLSSLIKSLINTIALEAGALSFALGNRADLDTCTPRNSTKTARKTYMDGCNIKMLHIKWRRCCYHLSICTSPQTKRLDSSSCPSLSLLRPNYGMYVQDAGAQPSTLQGPFSSPLGPNLPHAIIAATLL